MFNRAALSYDLILLKDLGSSCTLSCPLWAPSQIQLPSPNPAGGSWFCSQGKATTVHWSVRAKLHATEMKVCCFVCFVCVCLCVFEVLLLNK